VGPDTSHVHKITYVPRIDTALYVLGNVFDGDKCITLAIRRVGPKKSRLSWSNPFNGPCINHRSINSLIINAPLILQVQGILFGCGQKRSGQFRDTKLSSSSK